MAKLTTNINCTLQAVDNVTNTTLFNHFITNATNPNAFLSTFQTYYGFTGTAIIANFACTGVYIKNLGPEPSSPSGNITVSWFNGTATVTVATLRPNCFILISEPIEGPGPNISAVTVTADAGSTLDLEFVIWV